MEQNKNFNEHPHPCVGVMYPAFLNDVAPASWRDLPPDDMTLEEMESMVPFVTDYCPYLDEDDWSDTNVEFVNKPFDMSKVILST